MFSFLYPYRWDDDQHWLAHSHLFHTVQSTKKQPHNMCIYWHNLCILICMWIVSKFISIFILMHMYMSMYIIYTYIYMYIYICIYFVFCICILYHMYTHIRMHVDTQSPSGPPGLGPQAMLVEPPGNGGCISILQCRWVTVQQYVNSMLIVCW